MVVKYGLRLVIASIPFFIVFGISCSFKSKKIFYGSDYPDREFLETIKLTKKEFKKFKLKQIYQENIFYNNAREFLKKYE